MKIAEETIGAEMAWNRQMYLGHGGHILTFPVAKGALMNVVAFHSSQSDTWEGDWVQPLQKENLQRDFVGWGEKVTKIMEVSTSRFLKELLLTTNFFSSSKVLMSGRSLIILKFQPFTKVDSASSVMQLTQRARTMDKVPQWQSKMPMFSQIFSGSVIQLQRSLPLSKVMIMSEYHVR